MSSKYWHEMLDCDASLLISSENTTAMQSDAAAVPVPSAATGTSDLPADTVTTGTQTSPDSDSTQTLISGTSDKMIRFLVTPYSNQSIQLLEDNALVQKTGKPICKTLKTTAYVYCDQKLGPGDKLTIEIVAKETKVGYSSFIGVTTCSLKTITSNSKHVQNYCGRHPSGPSGSVFCTRGDAFILPLDDLMSVGEKFQIEMSDGAMFLLYQNKAGKVRHVPFDTDLIPFIIIDGDYNAMRIVPNSTFTEFACSSGQEFQFVASKTDPQRSVGLNPATCTMDLTYAPVTGVPAKVEYAKKFPKPAIVPKRIHSLLMDKSPAFVVEKGLMRVSHKFLVPKYKNGNVEISPDRMSVQKKTDSGPRIVFLTPRLTCGTRIPFLIESLSGKSTGSLFQFGLSSCDYLSLLENDCHSKGPCKKTMTCRGASLTYNVSSKLAVNCGSVIIFDREKNGSFRLYTGVVSLLGKMIEWTQASSFPKKCHPFLILNGDANSIRILDGAEALEKMADQTKSQKIPAVLLKPSPPYRFLIPSYSLSGIGISADAKHAERLSAGGSNIVYLSDSLIPGLPLRLRIDSKSVETAKTTSWSLVIGLTRCPPQSVKTQDWHAISICSKETKCHGISLTYGVSGKADINTLLTFTRVPAGVDIRVGEKKYEFTDRGGWFTGIPPYVFLMLTGDVSAVTILDLKEKIPPIQKPAPQKNKSHTSAKISASVEDSTERVLQVQDEDTGPVQADSPIDAEFLTTPYANAAILISEAGKRARRSENKGLGIVYLNTPLQINDTLSIQLAKFSSFKNSAFKLEFGVTTCDVGSICKHKNHVRSLCTNDGRVCGGRSFSFQVVKKGENSVIISFQRLATGVRVCCNGELLLQHKDKKKITRNVKSVVPFLILSGDVEEVRIADGISLPEAEENEVPDIPEEEDVPDDEESHLTLSQSPPSSRLPSFSSILASDRESVCCSCDGDEGECQSRAAAARDVIQNESVLAEDEINDTAGFQNSATITADESSDEFSTVDEENDGCVSENEEFHSVESGPREQHACPVPQCNGDEQFDPTPGDMHREAEVAELNSCNDIAQTIVPDDAGDKQEVADTHDDDGDTIRPEEPACDRTLSTSPESELSSSGLKTVEENEADDIPTDGTPLPEDFSGSLVSAPESEPSHGLLSQEPPEAILAYSPASEFQANCKPPEEDIVVEVIAPVAAEKSQLNPPSKSMKKKQPVHQQTRAAVAARKWYSNPNIRFRDFRMIRCGSGEGDNYIFSGAMRVGDMIPFRVSKIDVTSLEGAVYFGITTTPILKIDMSTLPPDPQQLVDYGRPFEWRITANLFNRIGAHSGFCLTRSEKAICLSLYSQSEGDIEVEVIRDVDPGLTVFPFFHMSGCVRVIQILHPHVIEPLCFRDQVRLYLVNYYLSLLQRAVRKN